MNYPDPYNVITAKTSEKVEVVAKAENLNVGHCPQCKQKMKTIIVSGIDSYICMEHRVVMPRENDASIPL